MSKCILIDDEHLNILKNDLEKNLEITNLQTYFPVMSLYFNFYNESTKNFIFKSNYLIHKREIRL